MPIDPPSQHRVRLGHIISEARAAAGLSQRKLAELAGRSQGWVNKIETAQLMRIKLADLDRVVEALSIPGDRAAQMRTYARSPYSERGVWAFPADAAWVQGRTQAEQLARSIFSFQLDANEGLLHCEAYMRRQFQLAGNGDIEMSVHKRISRQRSVFDSPRPPEYTQILNEGALYRNMGDPQVAIEQIEYTILAVKKRLNVTALVLPRNARVATQPFSFSMYQFANGAVNDFVLVDHMHGAICVDAEPQFRQYLRLAAIVRDGAYDQDDSIEAMQKALAYHKQKD